MISNVFIPSCYDSVISDLWFGGGFFALEINDLSRSVRTQGMGEGDLACSCFICNHIKFIIWSPSTAQGNWPVNIKWIFLYPQIALFILHQILREKEGFRTSSEHLLLIFFLPLFFLPPLPKHIHLLEAFSLVLGSQFQYWKGYQRTSGPVPPFY